MAIRVSTLLSRNTLVQDDSSPSLGGDLDTVGFEINNGSNPVTITGNDYPITTGNPGQVLSTNGAGSLDWINPPTGSLTLVGDVTGSGLSPVTTTLGNTAVTPGTYGSSSSVSTFTVNGQGRLTASGNASISITPSQAGLGNVANSLQVINAGGAPSIREGTGAPSGPDTLGAIYIDRGVTDGNGIFYYNGTSWAVIGQKLNLYDEKVNGFVAPVAAGLDSVALGSGAETDVTANNSLAIGLQSLARNPGGVVQASGRFASNGDAQAGRYLLRSTTISASPVELFIDGTAGTRRLVLTDDSTWSFKIMVTAHRTDLDDGRAGYTSAGVIYRRSGVSTTAIQGSVNKVVLSESNPSWDINISADSTNGSLRILVTGESGKIIRWVALVETVEITN
jgi:hypothetical protein